MTTTTLFNRVLRRRRRDRAANGYAAHDFLRTLMLEGIADRLAMVKRQFHDVLDLGSFDGAFVPPAGARVARLDAGYGFAHRSGGIQADEDRVPFADAAFDLIISAGVLDTIDDLPGALTLTRRMLRPDGLFLAAFAGGETLSTLRAVLLAAEAERPAARIHPRIDVRSAGDLLVRAGFALPVADLETIEVGYSNLARLLGDLRGMAATSLLTETSPLARTTLARAETLFGQHAGPNGRTVERFDIIFLTGWAPAPSQPKPAARGSGTSSLADALRPRAPR